MASIAAEREYYVDKLKTNGYISVPFGITGADIDPLFTQFREFLDICEQPGGQQFQEAVAYTPADRQSGGDYFVNRRRIGEINPHSVNKAAATEDKDLAHIGPNTYNLASEKLGGRMPQVMHQFLSSCVELHQATKVSVLPVFKALGLDKSVLAENPAEEQHVIRLIRYLGTTASHKADLHFDRSAFTLAARENHPGLVGTPAQNAQRRSVDIHELETAADLANHTPIAHHSCRAKFFLGAGYNRFPDELYDKNGELPLLLHGVLNERPHEERDAVVVFMHPPASYPGYQVPTKDETGIEGVRDYILRRNPPYADSAVA